MTYLAPRTDAPICVCGGGACERKTDCRRWLERKTEHAEKYPAPPYKHVRAIDAQGRPMNDTVQVCEAFLPRDNT